jgi:hypothetical protein
MATVFNRAAPTHRATDRRPSDNDKFSGASRVAIIFGSSIILWTIIVSMIVHYS